MSVAEHTSLPHLAPGSGVLLVVCVDGGHLGAATFDTYYHDIKVLHDARCGASADGAMESRLELIDELKRNTSPEVRVVRLRRLPHSLTSPTQRYFLPHHLQVIHTNITTPTLLEALSRPSPDQPSPPRLVRERAALFRRDCAISRLQVLAVSGMPVDLDGPALFHRITAMAGVRAEAQLCALGALITIIHRDHPTGTHTVAQSLEPLTLHGTMQVWSLVIHLTFTQLTSTPMGHHLVVLSRFRLGVHSLTHKLPYRHLLHLSLGRWTVRP